MDNKRDLLIAATIDLVAESGLNHLSLRQVTERAGTSDVLIYRYFSSKENLLFCCFETIDREIAEIFHNMPLPQNLQSPQDLYLTVRWYWMSYFKHLVSGGKKTLFYFAYRDSGYYGQIQAHNSISADSYFRVFAGIINAVDAALHFKEKVNSDYLWVYILDATGVFAKRVIRGELPDTEESYEMIWKLISAGMMGPVQSES